MENIVVEIINKSGNELPKYETLSSSGMDVKANLTSESINTCRKFGAVIHHIDEISSYEIIIGKGDRMIIPTGLFVAIPNGYEIQVRSRSGLALKSGIFVLNSPGTIDSKIIMKN